MSATYGNVPPTPVGRAEIGGVPEGSRARVSWSAIFAGVVLVVAIEMLLGLLGAGVGLGFVTPNAGTTPNASSFGAGAGIWWLVSTVIALIIGSYAAARLAGVPARFDGVLHGLVIWGLALLLTVYLITSAVGGLIGGAFSVIGGTVSTAGSVVGGTASAAGGGVKEALPKLEQASGINPNVLQQQAEDIIQSPTPSDPASMSRPDAAKAIAQALPDVLSGGDKAAAAKQRVTDIVAAQAHISPQDAQKRVDDAQNRLTSLKDQAAQAAKQTADATAAAASRASFLAFVGLLVGAVAAAIGGALASPRRVGMADGRFR
jgi:hypothetical protein